MKKVLFALSFILLSISCSKDPEPETLEKVLGDRLFAQYLSGSWNYTSTGKGLIYWSETLTFNFDNKKVSQTVMSNSYETLSSPKITRTKYEVSGKDEYITLKNELGESETYRIEQVSSSKFIMHAQIGSIQIDKKTYTRAK